MLFHVHIHSNHVFDPFSLVISVENFISDFSFSYTCVTMIISIFHISLLSLNSAPSLFICNTNEDFNSADSSSFQDTQLNDLALNECS